MRQLLQDMRDLLALAWPVVISRTGILTLSITDTVMVGHYASEHLAYVGIGMVPSNIFILVMIGLLMGTSVLVSNRFGGRDAKTGEVWWFSLPGALPSAWWGLSFARLAKRCFCCPARRQNWPKKAGAFLSLPGLVCLWLPST